MRKLCCHKNLQRLLRKATLLRSIMSATLICCGLFKNEDLVAASQPIAQNKAALELKASYAELSSQLKNNPFSRPIVLKSEESPHNLKGEIYAVVDADFPIFIAALSNPDQWCDAMILNINVKYCHVSTSQNGHVLNLNLGKKYPQPLADTYPIEFHSQGIITSDNYFAEKYLAKLGPLGTSDYRILVEAIPLHDGRTFLHFTYAYSFGLAGRLAMQTYFATLGRGKIGFTVLGKNGEYQPIYIQGIRGAVERNTMRFYLAIDAHLAALKWPSEQQLQKRLNNWYNSSEQYAIQLHELELDEYLAMKNQEYQRQQMPP